MKRAFVFPGQGSQAVGMGRELADAFPAAREVFDMVDEALGEKLSTLIFEGPSETLTLTENAQPALMAVSVAACRALEAAAGKQIADMADFVAGHSLGEYSALAAVRALELEDAARLLRLRGQSMQQAVPVGVGAMAAMLGVDIALAREIAAEAAGEQVCDVANDNGAGQVVLSGDKAAIERAIAIATSRGVKRSVLLPVSAPFHCSLMAPAADVMGQALAGVSLQKPSLPIIANVSAEAESDPSAIRQLLVQQVTGMVRWRESMAYAADQGVTQIGELGAGKVLTGLAKRIDERLEATAIGTVAAIEASAASFAG
ncbi:MAG: ACP S-malonyltransferase [Alphaproteobacteria bacterium]|nr:ACP S-malonyltransferase [Alphaproteobacteria bacterium]MBU0795601.1 ACP S-malonyltransferase [Alphaproteobacteria bacterium]MBU0887658.1 ACP S-malonyltransferase [Alphaproteobacteria bacterium]MBU1812915.1 ACP S-malonyltransferase [Alphaproteobacteria bacterium]